MRGEFCYCGNRKKKEDKMCDSCREIKARIKTEGIRNEPKERVPNLLRGINLRSKAITPSFNWKTDFKI